MGKKEQKDLKKNIAIRENGGQKNTI